MFHILFSCLTLQVHNLNLYLTPACLCYIYVILLIFFFFGNFLKYQCLYRFSALHGEEDHRNFQRSPSRGDGGVANRGMRQGPTAGYGRGKILARSSQEGERSDALANARLV